MMEFLIEYSIFRSREGQKQVGIWNERNRVNLDGIRTLERVGKRMGFLWIVCKLIVMGKTKTKFPVQIQIEFVLPLTDETYCEKQVQLRLLNSPLKYEHIQLPYKEFLEENNINYPTVMEYIVDEERYEINEEFEIDIPKFLDQFGNRFCIVVQNRMQTLIDQINLDIDEMRGDIQQIKDRLDMLPTRDQLQLLRKNSLITPSLNHQVSIAPPLGYDEKQLDLGVLFSQPIFDELRKKTAANPVDFRSEIQRLHLALKIKCEIATKQNLKHLIKFSKPRILHIICHGTREGALQFEDDSRTVIGALQFVQSQEIADILKTVQNTLPDVVFINSCYSQTVGQVFFQMGVNYVVMIDSEDTIEDEAAQIFSQHFYRNIFSGERVREAFKQAKQRVKMKHNSFGCCCRHSSKEKHKTNCRWLQMIKRPNSEIIDQQQKQDKHKLFHVPSELCKCELKNLNRHKINCEWAKQALFHINNDFRIQDQSGNIRFPKTKSELPAYLPKDELVICCCFNYQGHSESGEFRLPHSESNKFKILENQNKEKEDSVFENIMPSNCKQLFDYTSPQLVETHTNSLQSTIQGRQRETYEFMKRLKDLNQNIYMVYGSVGVGRTSFTIKSATYLIERSVFQMYFYVDLYGIRDVDIFRYKFNETTKFNYDGKVNLNEVRNKMIIIILDNADDFFELERDQLYKELKILKNQLCKSKIIITMKEENYRNFDFQKVHADNFYLEPLAVPVATRLIFTKMRHLFDVTVQYIDIDGLVRRNPQLKIPKIIQSVCQSFNSSKKKIKVEDIKKKLQTFGQGDTSGTKFIEENLLILKERSQESYEMLLFMSQFSEGISMDDFKMLSLYQKKDSKIHLPIGRNWQSVFSTLFQKLKMQDLEKDSQNSVGTNDEDSELSLPPLKNFISSNNKVEQRLFENSQKQSQKRFMGQSYFIEEVSQNRFIVKRFIRDFVWKKHESPSNYYMKHLFIGYMAVMLEIYFQWLLDSKFIHEDLLEYSALSDAGLFGMKHNAFHFASSILTESTRFAKEYNSEFERLINEHPSILEKIRKSDPSSFIGNHKQDFLNIYEKKWDAVFEYLADNKKNELKICVAYLENLAIFIPTAFKIAKVQNSLYKYVISKSMSLLAKLKPYSQDKKILIIQLKLQLMRAGVQIQKCQVEQIRSNLDFNKEFTIKLLQKLDKGTIQMLRNHWNYEKNYLLMYRQYVYRKQPVKIYIEKSKISHEKLKVMIEFLYSWIGDKWNQCEQILQAKRNLLVGLSFLNVIKNSSGAVGIHANTVKLKKQHERDVIQLVKLSAITFKSKDLIKLYLRAKLTAIQLYTEQINLKKKSKAGQSSVFYEELSEKQKQLLECEKVYTDRRNNLIGYAEFETEIKSLKRIVKNKLWQQSMNTFVCMRAVPITKTNGKSSISENLPRKKNKFRKQIEAVLDPSVDLCSKFQIFTQEKFREQVETGCTLLLISANTKVYKKTAYLVFEGVRMDQDPIAINKQFIQVHQMNKIKILILAGKNSGVAIRQLASLMSDPPIMISLGQNQVEESVEKFQEFRSQKDKDKEKQTQSSQKGHFTKIEEKKRIQIEFLKEFIQMLLNRQIKSKQMVVQICDQCIDRFHGLLEVHIEYKKRQSPVQIKPVKGSYKDLSPGYQKNHNIDMKVKSQNSNFIVLRRCRQTYRVLDYLRRNYQEEPTQPAYINIFGDVGSGKTCFVHEIARILVEREHFSSGIYIIDGKTLEKRYNGQVEEYFKKQSQVGRIMTLADFETQADERLILIIDDFQYVKPRANGRLNRFLEKIIAKRVNLIIVTHELYQKEPLMKEKQTKFIFNKIKPIKVEFMTSFEIDLVANNVLDLSNKKLMAEYQQLKKRMKSGLNVKQIYQLKSNFSKKKKDTMLEVYDSTELRKLTSVQN